MFFCWGGAPHARLVRSDHVQLPGHVRGNKRMISNPQPAQKLQLTIRWFPKKHSEHVQATSHDPGNELIQRHLKAQMSHKSAKPKLSTFLQSNQEIEWHPSPSVHVSCHCHFHFFISKWGAVPRVVGISKQKHMRYYVFKNTAPRKLRSNFYWLVEKTGVSTLHVQLRGNQNDHH